MRYCNRMNTNHGFYADIAREYCLKALSNYEEIKRIRDKMVDEDTENTYMVEYIKKEEELHKNCIITITFAAMSLESFIYDYTACVLGDEYTKKYIDRLDVIAKWVIVPKIIAGKEIPRNKHCFELLKQTIKLRNNFVHSKSRQFNPELAIDHFENYNYDQMIKYSRDSVKVIDQLASELEIIDPESIAKFKLHCKDE